MRDCHLVLPCCSLGRVRSRGSRGPASLTFLAWGEANPGPGGAEAAGVEGSGAGRSGGVVEVGAHTTNVYPCREEEGWSSMSVQLPATGRVLLPQSPSRLVLTPGSKESPIAWLVAIRPPIVLGTSREKVGLLRAKGGLSCVPQGPPPQKKNNRPLAVSVHWPGLVGLGGVRMGWNARIATVVGRKGKSKSESSVAVQSYPSKGMGCTDTTQAPQILAGVEPTG